jgi:hypothetical protein
VWSELEAPLDGYSSITSYNLQWLHNGNWQDLYGAMPGAVMTSFLLTSDITRGETYLFKLRAKNIHGWSAWSKQTSIKAAGKPYQSPVCTSENLGTQITLKWFEPDFNSEVITAYEVEI